jgi:hypothetical protein
MKIENIEEAGVERRSVKIGEIVNGGGEMKNGVKMKISNGSVASKYRNGNGESVKMKMAAWYESENQSK